jgi:hypothetical protein
MPEYRKVSTGIPAGTIDAIVFPLTVLTLTYLSAIIYYWDSPFQKDFQRLMVIITNAFGIFAIIVADGLFLKLCILAAMISSFWAHINWEGFNVPGYEDEPGRWDNIFSVGVIVAYCCTFLPDRWFAAVSSPKGRIPRWEKNFLYEPDTTSSFACTLSLKTLTTVLVTVGVGFVIGLTYEDNPVVFHIGVDFHIGDVICIFFAAAAIVFGLIYVCNDKKHLTSKGGFAIFITIGIVLAIFALVSKKHGEEGELPEAEHSIWHVCIFVAAYCISRAHSYIKKLKI